MISFAYIVTASNSSCAVMNCLGQVMHVLHRLFKYKLATQLLGRHGMLIREVINSVFALKGTNIKRQIVSLMAGGTNCFLSVILYFKKSLKTPFSCLLLTVKCRLICFQVRLTF